MAEAVYLVSRSQALGQGLINGVRNVLINKDDGQTDTQIKTAASVAASSAHESTGLYPADYFDTVEKISDMAAGPLKDNIDAYVIPADGVKIKVEGA